MLPTINHINSPHIKENKMPHISHGQTPPLKSLFIGSTIAAQTCITGSYAGAGAAGAATLNAAGVTTVPPAKAALALTAGSVTCIPVSCVLGACITARIASDQTRSRQTNESGPSLICAAGMGSFVAYTGNEMVKVTSAKTAALIGATGSTEVIIGAVPAIAGAAIGILCIGGVGYGLYKCVESACNKPNRQVLPESPPRRSRVQLSQLSPSETAALNQHLLNHINAMNAPRHNVISHRG